MLKISNVETFYGKIQALRGVDIDVNSGEIVSLIGSNGAGKSTLLMTISGVNKARNGEIKDFTGISAPFEVPENPEIEINTSELSIDESVQKVLDYVLPIIKNK